MPQYAVRRYASLTGSETAAAKSGAQVADITALPTRAGQSFGLAMLPIRDGAIAHETEGQIEAGLSTKLPSME